MAPNPAIAMGEEKQNVPLDEALTQNIVLVDFNLLAIGKIAQTPKCKRELCSRDNWKDGKAPLHLAAELGRVEIMEILIQAGFNVKRHVK